MNKMRVVVANAKMYAENKVYGYFAGSDFDVKVPVNKVWAYEQAASYKNMGLSIDKFTEDMSATVVGKVDWNNASAKEEFFSDLAAIWDSIE